MSVAMNLGVDNVNGSLMVEARRRWESCSASEPDLSVVVDLLDLPTWTRAVDAEAKDVVLRSLAKLGSSGGVDSRAATTVLTWLLVPGASNLAHQLSDLAANIDELVASHLWMSARTFEWQRRRFVAASILRDTRRGVLAELGVGEWARRVDRTWSQTSCVEPDSHQWAYRSQPVEQDPLAELQDLLEVAIEAGAISSVDRDLLIALAVASDLRGGTARRGRAGLMAPAVSEAVARQWGMSSRTVRRRASRSIDALAVFAKDFLMIEGSRVVTDGPRLAMGA